MPVKVPCKTCNNPLAKNHRAVECDKAVPGIEFLAQAK